MSDSIDIFFNDQMLQHDTGRGMFESQQSPYLAVAELHPENADRLRNMVSVLREGPLRHSLKWFDAEPASLQQMGLFHDPDYLEGLVNLDPQEVHWLTSTTVFGAHSWPSVTAAAGLTIGAAQRVWSATDSTIAYALVRPPGHHAQPALTDGYCFVNNIGVAIHVLKQQGLRRACVIDWDVHHGNGTQEGFYDDAEVLTISLHMDHGAWGKNHQQSGAADEVGRGDAVGCNINIPMPYGSGDAAYTRVFDELVTPAVRDFAPQLIVIASGQDANQFDPNGRQLLTMKGYRALGQRARELAEQLTEGKLLLVQEGGYAMSYAAYCLHATLEGVLGSACRLQDPIAYMPEHLDNFETFLDQIRAIRARAMSRN